jgi:hypothetical protein
MSCKVPRDPAGAAVDAVVAEPDAPLATAVVALVDDADDLLLDPQASRMRGPAIPRAATPPAVLTPR